MVRIWSVFNRDQRLVLAIADEPGVFNFSKPPNDDVEPIECAYATLQAYDTKAEPDLLNIILRCEDIQELLEALLIKGYLVIEGRPQPRKVARL